MMYSIFITSRTDRLKYLFGSLGQYTWAGHSVMVLSYPTHFWREGFTTFALSFLLFNNGASIGWSSPALPSFEADQDFSDKIGENIAAWIGKYRLTKLV